MIVLQGSASLDYLITKCGFSFNAAGVLISASLKQKGSITIIVGQVCR
jgi:hypothetical protein